MRCISLRGKIALLLLKEILIFFSFVKRAEELAIKILMKTRGEIGLT